MTRAGTAAGGVAAALAACAAGPNAAPSPDVTPVVGHVDTGSPSEHGGYDLLEVQLELTPDVAARRITARQRFTFRAEHDLTELRLDANALTITRAALEDDPATWRVEGDALVITLPRALPRGSTGTLVFTYEGSPARGLIWEEGGLYTSYFTCDWMICALNRPGDTFTFDVDVPERDGWHSFEAEKGRAYPAHVQGFAAGPWTIVRETSGDTELVFASGHADEADLRLMLADASRMRTFFERAAGAPFPHRTYTQLVVRGDAAQEGAGFAILGDDVVRPLLTDPHEDWAIAHEMAHAYWGNALTVKSWTHFWLSEGLTTFMVAAYKQDRWGEADYQREIELATRRWTRAREAGWDKPLAFAGSYPDLRTRRAIQYSKGMLFFVELRAALGEEAFWAGIRDYTTTHLGGAVESVDLQRALTRVTGRDLDALFTAWVYEPGR